MNTETARLRSLLYGAVSPYTGYAADSERYDLHGHGSGLDGACFKELIDRRMPGSILEIGSWKGSSAVKMARLAPAADIVCVDTWLGSMEFMRPPDNSVYDVSRVHGWPQVYFTFLNNMVVENLSERVTPFPLPSNLACRWLARHQFKFDFIYIDGSHETDDVRRDIEGALSVLEPGGVIFGDDHDWPTVRAALGDRPHRVLQTHFWELLL